MSPEQMRKCDAESLAAEACEALGVNGAAPTVEQIMNHSIGQANLELGVVEHVLEQYELSKHQDLIDLRYLVRGIRGRLSLAQNGAGAIDRIMNDKPWPNERKQGEGAGQ